MKSVIHRSCVAVLMVLRLTTDVTVTPHVVHRSAIVMAAVVSSFLTLKDATLIKSLRRVREPG
jgi:hypothetical protein